MLVIAYRLSSASLRDEKRADNTCRSRLSGYSLATTPIPRIHQAKQHGALGLPHDEREAKHRQRHTDNG